MYILGVSGGLDAVHESRFGFQHDYVHDSSAVLLQDGQVVAGVEEERLIRIKHTNKVWAESARFCLDYAGITLDDVDGIAIYMTEPFFNRALEKLALQRPALGIARSGRRMLQDLCERYLGARPRDSKLHFVHHHDAHAMSAYHQSGFDESLILAIDGAGEELSVLALDMRGNQCERLAAKGWGDSLGFYYLDVIRFLGYQIFDEYKVMGLAPYGDSTVFRDLFKTFYTLEPDGDYTIHSDAILALYEHMDPRDPRDDKFDKTHMDVAAALQESLEVIVFHVLEHLRAKTGHENLCLAGGVAQNSTMNGKILSSGLFKQLFVPPGADDAGCSVGAALAVAYQLQPELPRRRTRQSYWGPDIGSNREIESRLEPWSRLVEVRRLESPAAEAAKLIAGGAVIGWAQGRSEFGPRALGNRSILADPRVGDHKERINAMIKKRESYRPFAPSVLEERVAELFEAPDGVTEFPFMTIVLKVRPEHRATLAAVTHVDGSSRLQTVARESNPLYWELIRELDELTGVPVVLNTSFNNNAEPIVNSVEDALVCFLTSGLEHLVVGEFLVDKRDGWRDELMSLRVSLPAAARAVATRSWNAEGLQTEHAITWNYDESRRTIISAAMYHMVSRADGQATAAELAATVPKSSKKLAEELFELWSARMIRLHPQPSERAKK